MCVTKNIFLKLNMAKKTNCIYFYFLQTIDTFSSIFDICWTTVQSWGVIYFSSDYKAIMFTKVAPSVPSIFEMEVNIHASENSMFTIPYLLHASQRLG